MLSEELLEKLLEGLYLAGVGMGLVFASLVAFLLVLLVIRRVYPDSDTQSEQKMNAELSENDSNKFEGPVADQSQEPTKALVDGEKIAAMAVAVYMQMEEEENIGQLVSSQSDTFSIQSNWKLDGRNALMGSQGHRPNMYGERSNADSKNRRGN